jgi:hypothetical protein
MSNYPEIKRIALDLLNRNPDPSPSFIIIRDLLDTPENQSLFIEAKQKLLDTRWVKELEESQLANGTWGRFHTQNTFIKTKFARTEIAINRALALGLDMGAPLLGRSAAYMSNVLNGMDSWSDHVEKFNEWKVTTGAITAAVLSRLDRVHPDLDNIWHTWTRFVEGAFKSGGYNLTDELTAFEEVTGICPTARDSKLYKMYPLQLLGSTRNRMPSNLERAYLDWVWHKEGGIYYLTSFSMDLLPEITSKHFPLWLRALGVFSDYSYGKSLISNPIEYLWSLANSDAIWDFGVGSQALNAAKIHCGWNISDSWREPVNRQIDTTVRILLLLKKFYS